jgi:drug/metabolite transporter superfamily protein YnfA
MSKAQVISELWQFMRENKKYWLAPIVITLVVFGVVLVLAKGSAIAPFIYTLF